ncbi:MAG: LysR family transcriptional regulator, partial [Alphaproteobacteria bacterium]
EGRLALAFDGHLRGPSDFYLIWPRYRKSIALQAVTAWMLAQTAGN